MLQRSEVTDAAQQHKLRAGNRSGKILRVLPLDGFVMFALRDGHWHADLRNIVG
jgi:hypothetical protein